MIHGKGSQDILTESYQNDRVRVLKDRSKYNDEQIRDADLTGKFADGGGKTDINSFIIKQFPYPVNSSIKQRKKLDLRAEDPRTGGN